MAGLSAFERQRWLTAAMKHERTTHKGRAIAAALTTFHNTASGQCNPSQRTLGERAGLGETATRDGVRELVDAGLVIVRPTKGGVSQYDLVPVDPPVTAAPDTAHPRATHGTTPSPRTDKPESSNLKRNPAPLAPEERILAVMKAFDPPERRPALRLALDSAGQKTHQPWGSPAMLMQIAMALKLGHFKDIHSGRNAQ